jgi:hypothetical protein
VNGEVLGRWPILRRMSGLTDDHAVEYDTALSHPCEFCGVPVGSPCLTNSGEWVTRPHQSRLRSGRR